MPPLRNKVANFFLQLLDLLIDAAYLLSWGTLSWLVLRALNTFHPGKIIMLMLWFAQGTFAAFALAIILLHLAHDLTLSKEEYSDSSGPLEKLKDISNHLLDLAMLFIMIVLWAVINSGVHIGLELVRSQASMFLEVSAWILEAAFAVRTLLFACKKNFEELKGIRVRLFPKQTKQPAAQVRK